MSILVIGSIHMDQNYKLDHLPKKGETILAKEAYPSFGGKGLNQAIAAVRCGGDVELLGSLGRDEAGKAIRDFLTREGLDPSHLIDREAPTGSACIYVDPAGDNTIVVNPGADWQIKGEDLEKNRDLFQRADFLVLQFELPSDIIYRALEMGRDYGLKLLVNPAPAMASFDESYYPFIDYLIPNETELAILSKSSPDPDREEDQARSLLEKGVKKLLLTQGDRGSTLFSGDGKIYVPSESSQVKDTTGAGDSYIGAFVYALSKGKGEGERMKYTIKGESLPVVIFQLEAGESLFSEAGGRTWMKGNIKTSTNSGGLGKSLGRMFSGESLFLSRYEAKGPAEIAFASSFPGQILARELAPGESIIVQKRAFLCATPEVDLSIFFRKKFSTGLFGGEGFIMQKLTGPGIAFLEIDGYCEVYDLKPGERLVMDTGTLAVMDESCEMTIEQVEGLKNIFFGGEGLFNTVVTGPGKVVVQSMPIQKLAQVMNPYMMTNS